MDNVLTAFYTSPWAILPSKHAAIEEAVQRHAIAGHTPPEIVALYAAQNRRPQPTRSGKVAVLPVYGVIAQRMNMIMEASGGTSTELLGKQLQALIDDPEVTAIVLDIDSPGGGVEGVGEVAAQIYAARGVKPIVAVANPLAASAAYWIGSAASEFVVGPTAEVGSIGVFMVHTDRTAADAKAGVTRTVIRAGDFKAEGVHEPLSAEALAYRQAMVEDVYAMFTADVAKHRGTTVEAVKKGYGQGRTQMGARAVSSGLADRVGTLDGVIAELTGTQTRIVRVAAAAGAIDLAALGATDDPLSVLTMNDVVRLKQIANAAAPPPTESPPIQLIPTDTPPNAAPDRAALSHPPNGTEGTLGTDTPTLITLPAPKAKENTVSENVTAAPGAAPVVTAMEERGVDRGKEIAALCQMARVPDRTTDYILSSKSVEDVRKELHQYATQQMSAAALPPRQQIESYEDDKHRFDLGRAVKAASRGDWSKAGYEREVSNDIERRLSGISMTGEAGGGNTFYFPTVRKLSDEERESRMQATSLSVGVASNGGNLVFTEYGGFIDLLRSRVVLLNMGATFLPGLVGNVAFPRQITAGTSAAQPELTGAADITESNLTLDQVTLSPKTIMARQSYSNQLLAQGVINVDALIRNDLAKIQARKLDLLGLHGVGSSNEPTGLYAASGVNTVTFSGGPTFAKCVDMVTAVSAADADLAGQGYVFTPEIAGKAQQTPTFTNTGTAIWTGGTDGQVNGYRAMASNQLSKVLVSGTFSDCHGAIFGAWPECLVGEWGGMAITVDPYTLAAQDRVRIIAREFFDVGVRHGAAFTKAIQLRNV